MSNQNEQESAKLTKTKSELRKATFHIQREKNGIISFRFESLTRMVLVQFVDYLQARHYEFEPPIRFLFDFRGAGAPSRYMVDRVPKSLAELNFPADTRLAYIVDGNLESRFIHAAMQTWQVGTIAEFVNYDPAVRWLLA